LALYVEDALCYDANIDNANGHAMDRVSLGCVMNTRTAALQLGVEMTGAVFVLKCHDCEIQPQLNQEPKWNKNHWLNCKL
jgi:hypothetical protein